MRAYAHASRMQLAAPARACGVATLPVRRPALGNDAIRQLVAASASQVLPDAVRAEMEARFGQDFSAVRVHDGPGAADMAAALSAEALTIGQDVVFGAGRFTPDTDQGRSLLAHELAHVVQQSRGGVAPTEGSERILEASAEQAAAAVTHGAGAVEVAGAAAPSLARQATTAQPKLPRRDVLSIGPDGGIFYGFDSNGQPVYVIGLPSDTGTMPAPTAPSSAEVIEQVEVHGVRPKRPARPPATKALVIDPEAVTAALAESKDLDDAKLKLGLGPVTDEVLSAYLISKGFTAPDTEPNFKYEGDSIGPLRDDLKPVGRIIYRESSDGMGFEAIYVRDTEANLEALQQAENVSASNRMGEGLATAAAGIGNAATGSASASLVQPRGGAAYGKPQTYEPITGPSKPAMPAYAGLVPPKSGAVSTMRGFQNEIEVARLTSGVLARRDTSKISISGGVTETTPLRSGGAAALDDLTVFGSAPALRPEDVQPILKSIRRHNERLIFGKTSTSDPILIEHLEKVGAAIASGERNRIGSAMHELHFEFSRPLEVPEFRVNRRVLTPGEIAEYRIPDFRLQDPAYVPGRTTEAWDYKLQTGNEYKFYLSDQFADIRAATGVTPTPLFYRVPRGPLDLPDGAQRVPRRWRRLQWPR